MIRYASLALTLAAAGVLAAGQSTPAQAPDTQSATSAAGQAASETQQKASKHKDKSMDQASSAAGAAAGLGTMDKNFVTKAAQGGMAEVKLGQLAQERGSTDAVKNFGRQMVEDHTKANDQLKTLAQNKGITLPDSLDAKDQAEYDRLSKLSGSEFDQAYMKFMRKDHKKDVAMFRKESESGQDPEIKSFASSTLPTLETHLRLAEATGMPAAGAAGTAAGAATGTGYPKSDTTRTDNTGAAPDTRTSQPSRDTQPQPDQK
jgi:putative membrane protein